MMIRRFAIVGLCVTAATAAVLAMQAFGQYQVEPRIRYEEETIDRTLPNGKVERITVKVPVQENVVVQSAGGRYGVQLARPPLDTESQKLLADEQALVQEVRRLTDNLQGIEGTPEDKQTEWKSQIREKLATIFDLQQQRRTREIAKIEERLGKLKDVLKKRDTAKDSIVDRRLQTLTGGVDELGWEESLPTPNYSQPGFAPTLPVPRNVPRAGITIPGPPSLDEPNPLTSPVAVPPLVEDAPRALPPANPVLPVEPVPSAVPAISPRR